MKERREKVSRNEKETPKINYKKLLRLESFHMAGFSVLMNSRGNKEV